MPDKPNAIFATSDIITSPTLLVLNKLGIKIPAQMALVGFINSSFTAVLGPPLSSVYLMGQKAGGLLLSLVKSKNAVTEFETVVLPVQLVAREPSSKFI